MSVYDASTARCRVYAFKEGLLSAVGHDVQLAVQKFSVSVDGGQLHATFDPASLEVVCAMRSGSEDHRALSDKDKATIEGYVRDDILHARRYPKIEFRSTSMEPEDDGWRVEGQLTLHGRSRSIGVEVSERGDDVVTKVRLNQADYGIAPFRALLGALRIQPQVDVELIVPRSALG